MGFGDFLLGVLALALIAGPLAAGAVRVRARLLPGWGGAPARVAEAVLAIGALVVVSELLGSVGLFRAAALVPACMTLGVAGWRWGAPPGPAEPPPPQSRALTWVALAGALLVALPWLEQTYHAIHNGMSDSDTLWYHLPYAARWVQEGSLTGLHFTSYEPLTTFYPSTPSVLHAVGMLAFGNELASPFLNLGWLTLALVAGWAIGRPYGVAPATLLGSALAMGSPIIVGMQAGSAKDDAPGVALLLAAVALLVNARERDSADVRGFGAAGAIAALAAGLLLGTKLSMVAPALALMAVAVVAAPRARRLSTAGVWAGVLAVGGGFWYLRNLARTGNPAPWFEVDLGPLHLPSPELAPYTERHVTHSVADYLTDDGFIGDYLQPALEGAFGPAWWAVLALALGGALAVLLAGGSRLHRALGAASLAMALAYVLTPGGAGGSPDGVPHLVFWSMRYLTPALALGLVVLPLLPALRGRTRWVLAAYALALVATQFADSAFKLWDGRPPLAVLLAPFALAGVLLLARVSPRLAAAVVVAVLLAAGWKAQDIYLREGYTDPASPLAGPFQWARDVEDARIGVVGFYLQAPLLGKDLSNHVQYVGHEGGDGDFRTAATCREWREAVNAGDYDYLIAAPFNFPWQAPGARPPEPGWTDGDPHARTLRRYPGHVTLIHLRGPLDPDGCPAGGEAAPPRDQPSGPRRPS